MIRLTFRRPAAAAICLVTALFSLSACKGSGDDDSSAVTTTAPSTDGVPPVVQEQATYSFPQFFVDNKDNISLYSNLVYNSFDSQTANTAVAEQPFASLTCETSFLDGRYYSYITGDKKGIVGADGNIMLSAAYTEISLVRPDTFLLVTDNGSESFAIIEESGVITPVAEGETIWFETETPVQIKSSEDNDNTTYYLESARGKTVYNTYWDYLEPISLDIASTAAFSAYDDDGYYYIVFDKYYNYKVYEGSYATVEVFVGGQYGNCFILSSEHLNQISTMIDSFGTVSGSVSSPNDPAADYVKFVFGNTKSEVTISSSGFCYTEEINPEDGMSHKYFTIVDKLCFADVIDWIDKELSQEYVIK